MEFSPECAECEQESECHYISAKVFEHMFMYELLVVDGDLHGKTQSGPLLFFWVYFFGFDKPRLHLARHNATPPEHHDSAAAVRHARAPGDSDSVLMCRGVPVWGYRPNTHPLHGD